MQCREARDLLDSFLGAELLVETNLELLRHLESCPECRAELDSRRELRGALRTAFNRADALSMPAKFPGEVLTRLRSTSTVTRPGYQTRLWLAVAATVVLAAAGSLFWLAGGASLLARNAVGDHRNCALQFRLAEKPISLAEAAARYDPAFSRLENVPINQMTTSVGPILVVERHSCVYAGRRFAHVVLKVEDRLVSLLVTSDDGTAAKSARDPASSPQLAWLPSIDGFNVASFTAPGHIVFVVSDVRDPLFREVAEALAQPVYRTLLGA